MTTRPELVNGLYEQFIVRRYALIGSIASLVALADVGVLFHVLLRRAEDNFVFGIIVVSLALLISVIVAFIFMGAAIEMVRNNRRVLRLTREINEMAGEL